MGEKSVLTVYTLENCPNCELLKDFLGRKGIKFHEEDMSSAASLTELRVNGVFAMEAPVLRRGDTFLTTLDLFSGGKVKEDSVGRLAGGRL
ncbi:MAG: glutaredoxin family protein [Methanomicrobiales archaeon]|nr:glutaredoxin family protein [Methanomicrobiales archaeon]MDD1668716.1 glutaredoxin family protein [Methanomicrobiales archaeon]